MFAGHNCSGDCLGDNKSSARVVPASPTVLVVGLVHPDLPDRPDAAWRSPTGLLPIRWTEVNQIRPDLGAKQEVEILGLHIPPEWKRLTGMDMSEEGELMIGSPPSE